MIPPFTLDGRLPPGIHHAEWSEFAARFGSTARRKVLLTGLRAALGALAAAGGSIVYVDGSFVTDKPNPGDWDGCWEEEGVDLDRLEPVFLDLRSGRAAQKARFLGEMFLAHAEAAGEGTYMVDFFQKDRDGVVKGIVALDVRRLG